MITDIEHQAEWYSGVTKTERISEFPEVWRIHVGADYSEIKINGKVKPNYEISMLRHMVHITMPSKPLPFHYDIGISAEEKYTVEPDGAGSRLTIHSKVTNKSLRARLYGRLCNTLKRSHEIYHEKIAARVRLLKGTIYLNKA